MGSDRAVDFDNERTVRADNPDGPALPIQTIAPTVVLPGAPDAPAPEAANPVTDAMRDANAKVLYTSTVERMVLLGATLMQLTDSGDYALWAPLATMHQLLATLHWGAAQPLQSERLLAVCTLASRKMAEDCGAFLLALVTAQEAGAAPPAFPPWTVAVTDEIYAQAERLVAGPTP